MDVHEAVAGNRHWYHTLELAPGGVTPGHFDLRPIAARRPWPGVPRKRGRGGGTYDGVMAFELERRGAREVVATDLSAHEEWDWPADVLARGPGHMRDLGEYLGRKGEGFEIARRALGSSVEKVEVNVYDLDP